MKVIALPATSKTESDDTFVNGITVRVLLTNLVVHDCTLYNVEQYYTGNYIYNLSGSFEIQMMRFLKPL